MTIKKVAEILAYLEIPIFNEVVDTLAKYDIDLKDTVVKSIFKFDDFSLLFDSLSESFIFTPFCFLIVNIYSNANQ